MKNLLFLFLVVFSHEIWSQELIFGYKQDITVQGNLGMLKNPWAGGLNSAQFVAMDLNGDEQDDLIIFDRTNQKLGTFLSKGIKNISLFYQYAPEYEYLFPSIENWLILIDFDGDKLKDIFTSSPGGIKVYRNISQGSILKFEKMVDPLYTDGFAGRVNLYVGPSDIPAIGDVDGDGDVDIVAFESAGHYLELHKNLSKELTNRMGLTFQKWGDCWGNFIHTDCREIQLGLPCNALPVPNSINGVQKSWHTGNSICFLDDERDGIVDLLFGHVGCQNLVHLKNAGTKTQANFLTVNYDFPQGNSVKVGSFAAAFPIDVDGDGKVEIVVSTNTADNAGFLQDFQNSSSLYRFENGEWNLKSRNFMQGDMIDVGEGASPIWKDVDGDGDLDLLVGNAGIRGTNGVRASISFFENTGTKSMPNLKIKETDYLGLSTLVQATDFQLQSVDMDMNGLPDLLIGMQTFTGPEIWILYAGRSELVKWKKPEITAGEKLFFLDVYQNGSIQCLVLEKMGKIRAYDWPTMQLINADWGKLGNIQAWQLQTFVVSDLDMDGRLDFLGLDRDGKMHFAHISPTNELIWSSVLDVEKLKFGARSMISVTDFDLDGRKDLLVGLHTGGVLVLENKTKSMIADQLKDQMIQCWPNPTSDYISVLTNQAGTIKIVDLLGRVYGATKSILAAEIQKLDLSFVAKGIYWIRFETKMGDWVDRKIVVD